MAKTRISLIGELYDCVKPLFDGTIQIDGAELVFSRSPSPEAMRRQLTAWEFDICEMAFGAYLIARAQGADVTAIPVYPRRAFFHTNFACPVESRLASAHKLSGLRIGVAEYVQSATVWARGALEHDFGLAPRTMQWYVERAGSGSTGEVLGFRPPHDVSVQQTPGGKSLVAMLAAQELDLALVGESALASGSNTLRPLFADAMAEGRRFFDAHGYIPANHTYMVRGSLAREQPALVASLYQAFQQAKAHAQQTLPRERSPGHLFGSELLARTAVTFAGDPFSYGISGNRAMLDTVIQLCVEQGLVRDPPSPEQLFAACVQDS